jgi:hypothetical protein
MVDWSLEELMKKKKSLTKQLKLVQFCIEQAGDDDDEDEAGATMARMARTPTEQPARRVAEHRMSKRVQGVQNCGKTFSGIEKGDTLVSPSHACVISRSSAQNNV